jgi:hypothetical protein
MHKYDAMKTTAIATRFVLQGRGKIMCTLAIACHFFCTQ